MIYDSFLYTYFSAKAYLGTCYMVAHCGAEAVAITSLSVEAKEFMFTLGLHRISASASAKPKFGHFSQIRLRPNFWPNLAEFGRRQCNWSHSAVRSVSYLITGKTNEVDISRDVFAIFIIFTSEL